MPVLSDMEDSVARRVPDDAISDHVVLRPRRDQKLLFDVNNKAKSSVFDLPCCSPCAVWPRLLFRFALIVFMNSRRCTIDCASASSGARESELALGDRG